MKKIFGFLLLILLSISFASCNKTKSTFNLTYKLLDTEETVTNLKEGEVITLKTPTKDGYEFQGWFLDPEFKKPASNQLTITSDVNLYAKFVQRVKFIEVSYSVDGTIIKRINQQPNQKVITIKNPAKEGMIFEGWYFDQEFTNKLTDDYLLSSDITLFAKFTKPVEDKLLVIFYVDNNIHSKYFTKKNEKVIFPTKPNTIGKFKGWATSEDETNIIDENYVVTQSLKLYAIYDLPPLDEMNVSSLDSDFTLKKDKAKTILKDGVLFIPVEEFLKTAEGIIDYDTKTKVHNMKINGDDFTVKNYLEYRYSDGIVEIVSVSEYIAVDPNKQSLNDVYRGKMTISTIDKKVVVDNYDFFNKVYAVEEQADGGYDFKVTVIKDEYSDTTPQTALTYDFAKYKQPILKKESNVLIPLATLNLLFLHESLYQLVTNNDEIFVINGYKIFDDTFSLGKIQNPPNYGTDMPQGLKQYQYDFMCFALDHYYGIRPRDGKNYQEILEKYKNKMTSGNNDSHYNANLDIINDLEDMHTWLNTSPMFYEMDNNDLVETYKGRKKTYYDTEAKLSKLRKKHLKVDYDTNDYDIRYTDDQKTAIIKFDSFDIDEENINESTPYILESKLKEVKDNHTSVKNIVFDLSNNIGGVVYTIYEILGFMTDQPIINNEYIAFANLKTHSEFKSGFTKFNYKYFLLTSPVTFSSGNMMVGLCKDNHLATIIGYKTGGGASSTIPIFTPNGMYINISSNFVYTLNDYTNTEFGIEPDVAFELQSGSEKYSNLFDLKYIRDIVNRVNG